MKHKKKRTAGRFLSILLAAVIALSWLPADTLSPVVRAEETGYDEAAGGAGAEEIVSTEEDGNAASPEESGTEEDDTEEPETGAGSTEEPESEAGNTEEPESEAPALQAVRGNRKIRRMPVCADTIRSIRRTAAIPKARRIRRGRPARMRAVSAPSRT